MIGKLLSTGFSLATLPARLTFRSVRALAMTPAEANRLLAGMRETSDQAVREIQGLLANVDAEMTHKAGHLSAADKRLAAELALQALTVKVNAGDATADDEERIFVLQDGLQTAADDFDAAAAGVLAAASPAAQTDMAQQLQAVGRDQAVLAGLD